LLVVSRSAGGVEREIRLLVMKPFHRGDVESEI
jgi:hypothetical protein